MNSAEFFIKATDRTFWKETAPSLTGLLPREKSSARVGGFTGGKKRTSYLAFLLQPFSKQVTFS
jgi:hypothetical protein